MLWRIVMVVGGSARAINCNRPAIALTLGRPFCPGHRSFGPAREVVLGGTRSARVAGPAIVPFGSSFLAPSGFGTLRQRFLPLPGKRPPARSVTRTCRISIAAIPGSSSM